MDATNNTISYQLTDDAQGRFIIDSATGVITVANSALLRYELGSDYVVHVLATSSDGSQSSTAFSIQLYNLNDAPVAIDDTFSLLENGVQNLNVLLNDYDLDPGDNIRIVAASILSGLGNISLSDSLLSYQPGTNYDYLSVGESETVLIEYRIEDNDGLASVAYAVLTIHGERDTLVLDVSDKLANEDESFLWPIIVTPIDTNGEVLTSLIVTGLPEGTLFADSLGQQRIVASDSSVELFGLELTSLNVHVPENVSGNFVVNVSTESDLGPVSRQSLVRTIDINAVADLPDLIANDARGQLGTIIPISLQTALTDVDGSEFLTLHVTGVPKGMAIGDNIASIISESEADWYDISSLNLTTLHLNTTGGFNGTYQLIFRATSIESSNFNSANNELRVQIVVDSVLPVIDSTVISLPSATNTNSEETRQVEGSSQPGGNDATEPTGVTTDTSSAIDMSLQPEAEPSITPSLMWTWITLGDTRTFATPGNEDYRIELSIFETNSYSSSPLASRLANLIFEQVQFIEYRITNQSDSDYTVSSEPLVAAANVNSAVLMLWNMIRFTITTLPTVREQEITDEVRPVQPVARHKPK